MEIGTTLSQYRITAKLGEGGMGEVYQADDTRLKRSVAIKVLPAELAADPDRLARLEREAQVLARLEHPYIAAIYGLEEAVPEPASAQLPAGSESGIETEAITATPVRFLVMQLADGDTLDVILDRRGGVTGSGGVSSGAVTAVSSAPASESQTAPIRERGLRLDDVLPIAGAIADALEAAHDEGIVHRDLKPANIKVAFEDGAPQVKVLDFGLAKVYQADPGSEVSADLSASPTMMAATNAGVIMGTAAYMSPEQARGQRVDQRSDIWAFGVVLYEMLTGRRLFHGPSVSDTLASVLKDEIDFDALPIGTPLPIRRLLRRCLQRDRRRRIRNIGDARLEIEEAAAGLLGDEAADVAAIVARGDVEVLTGGVLETGPTRATFTWVHAVAAVALVVIGAAITLLALPTIAPTEPPVRTFGDLGPSEARSAVISPDGTKLALHIGDGLWVRDFASLTARRIEGSEIAESRPFWSPDSTRIAFIGDRSLWIASAEDGATRRVAYEEPLLLVGGTWAPRGIIVAAGRRGDLVLVPPDGGDSRVVASKDGGFLRSPTILPDGETLVYELSQRGDGAFPSGTVMVQHGLDANAEIETIVDGDDRYVGFQYSEELELLLIESVDTGIWAIPLSRDGFRATGPLERLVRNAEDMSLSRDGIFLYRAIPDRLEFEPFRWVDRAGNVVDTIESEKKDLRWISLSPDGTRVAFASPREAEQAPDIWVRDLVRGAETRITSGPGTGGSPDWVDDELLVLSGPTGRVGSSEELLTQAASGVGAPVVVAAEGVFRHPVASRDGRYIVFEMLLADGEPATAAAGGFAAVGDGARGAAPPFGSGRGANRQQAAPGGQRGDPTGGRRGGRGRRPGGASGSLLWALFYVEDGGDPQRYNETDDQQIRPSLSPDGTRIAFFSDASGEYEVWVDTFPQPTEQVRISSSGASHARWSPKGDEVFYDDGAGTLWAVPVDNDVPHGRPAYLEPTRLFDQSDVATRFDRSGERGWDVGPDGNTFLTVQLYRAAISPVNVIVNFSRWYRERR